MKNKIIDEAIKSLRDEGLKFSVDMLAARLKISKKTVYKYFPDKEALAVAMYEKYYAELKRRAEEICAEDKSGKAKSDLLYLYFDAKVMTRAEIFNKYKLNDVIRSYTKEQNDGLWETVFSAFPDILKSGEEAAVRVIIDGAFEKLCETGSSPDGVIERLVKLL